MLASASAMNSPSRVLPSPLEASSEIGCWNTRIISCTLRRPALSSRAISSARASRLNRWANRSDARVSRRIASVTCTGIRIVRD
jgi:hypothetical protein